MLSSLRKNSKCFFGICYIYAGSPYGFPSRERRYNMTEKIILTNHDEHVQAFRDIDNKRKYAIMDNNKWYLIILST